MGAKALGDDEEKQRRCALKCTRIFHIILSLQSNSGIQSIELKNDRYLHLFCTWSQAEHLFFQCISCKEECRIRFHSCALCWADSLGKRLLGVKWKFHSIVVNVHTWNFGRTILVCRNCLYLYFTTFYLWTMSDMLVSCLHLVNLGCHLPTSLHIR